MQDMKSHPPRVAPHRFTAWQNDKNAPRPFWAKDIILPKDSVLDLEGFDASAFIRSTLAEDLGQDGDITAASVIPVDARFLGVMSSREDIVAAGLPLAAAFFKALDPESEIELLVKEGDFVSASENLINLKGKARALLSSERSALNLCQHLSGVATLTRRYVEAIEGTGVTLLDTRKTIPGLRLLEKYATRMGGAQNHRMGLDDGAMIKDNHIAVAGSVTTAVHRAVDAGIKHIIVEIDHLDQIKPALDEGATHLLLDNMNPATLRKAVALVDGQVPTEASGGIRLDNIRAAAETGVTYISVGRLTQSAPAVDIGLDFTLSALF
ncbi:MAG: carboxylating nicotinate-nucleotide diphosphorylase [Zymomonas mobilis subsp. pomaceae]|uniref:carboxylating nicotinate-nucleotide diphosphorylase n=1 Tax=Zymomonas mobilis TaxID=542 RepID=UPI0039ED7289